MQSLRLLLCQNYQLNAKGMLTKMCDSVIKRASKKETRESGKSSIKRTEEKTTRKR